MRPGRLLRRGSGMAAVLLMMACEGENVFQPRPGLGDDGSPPEVEIMAPREPAANPLGDSLLVAAHVEDRNGVDSVVFTGVSLRGDASLGTDTIIERFESKSVTLDAATDTLVTRYLIPLPDSTREDAVIVATVYDRTGNSSADTVNVILGGPRVHLLNIEEGQTVQSGLSLSVRIEAFDPQGLIQVQVQTTGATEQTLIRSFNPPVDSIVFDTSFVIPEAAEGRLGITASARSTLDVAGQDGPVTVTVVSQFTADTIRPAGLVLTAAPARMELQDSVSVRVVGTDNLQGSGIQRVGFTVLAISPARGDTVVSSGERFFTPARTGTVSELFQFAPINVDTLSLPDTLVFEVTGYLIDSENNCAASVSGDSILTLPCQSLPTGEIVAENQAGQRVVRPVVAGVTVRLPRGGKILDAVVDVNHRNLFLSNIGRDAVEVFRLTESQFLAPIPVGSEPWGLSLNRGGDTLLVANSGGTNVSNVFIGPPINDPTYTGPFLEDPSRRFLTPDVVLFDIERGLDDTGGARFTSFVIPDATPPGFSDRPQFMAVDSTGRILYSTKTTLLGDFGTIRKAFVPAGTNRPEVVIFLDHAPLLEAPDFVAVGNIDNVGVVLGPPDSTGVQDDEVVLTDHLPGTLTTITGGPGTIEEAVFQLAQAGSDVVAGTGRWSVPGLGFSDTTFVAASGDGGWVVFGEGSVSPVGRVIMYDAASDRISNVVQVTDLMTNASETVRGLGLNHDGTLGVARGFQAYFFSTDLRAQGVADLPQGGAGAAMHPLHANYPSLQNIDGAYDPDTHLAFLGTGEGTIDIIDAFHFNRLGRIFIRDVISGPLRAALPFPEDNAGLQCQTKPVFNGTGDFIGDAIDIFSDAAGTVPYPVAGGPTEDLCVVLKLYAVTDAGGVVVVDVRKGDILREHPSRP